MPSSSATSFLTEPVLFRAGAAVVRSVDIGATRLQYIEEGSAEPLVFVHGSASDFRTWERQLSPFAERFRVIAYSRRYHWPNDPIPQGADYSMSEHVEDLAALLRGLGAAPAHLVGHSYGAFVCLLLAIREPRLVRSLVLAEPPVITLFVSSRPKPLEILRLLATRPRTAMAIIKFGAMGAAPAARAFRRGDNEAGVRIFGDAVFGAGGYGRLPESRMTQVRDNLTNVRAEVLGSGFERLDAGQVRKVEIPALLVSAQNSIPLFHRLTERLAQLLPHAERSQIPGATHAVHEDNARAFNAAVLPFVAMASEE
jgi:non-heme chloroperoxidase